MISDVEKIKNSEYYYVPAKVYLETSKYLYASPLRKSHGMTLSILPMNLLLAFSLELYLKSWLAYCGYIKYTFSSRKFGHNLNNLYDHCLKNGMNNDEEFKKIIYFYHEPHKDFEYRYFDGSRDLKCMDFLEIITIIDSIEDCVDKFIGASARPRQYAHELDLFLLQREQITETK
ncbi:hypothetical protein [Ancylobacter sp. SL191]|uniref:hypothetical protein n=1 Tax=Ancylobacter sp. SL191 TaxID=2995166 RepID=UPI00226E5A56|nr:hypothetical protein [Ancylobacter sp. SL191]WAC26513.1 hypothetical protein OU996_16040 [Ancylobacter sp. SL191]